MMQHRNVIPLILSLFLLYNSADAQKAAERKETKDTDPVLATVGNETITASEFERLYTKNANSQSKNRIDSSQASDRRQFLDMVVKYRVKLAEAYRQQLDKDPEINDELNQYKKNISTSYYLEHQLVEPNTKLLYERKKTEVHAAHIFIAVRKNATPEDTLKAYTRAHEALAEAQAGVSFDSLVKKYSEDTRTKFNGGDLGIFSAGFLLGPLEDECYTLKVGEISKKVIRSLIGYHIMRVLGRMPATNDRRISHIMIRVSPDDQPQDTLKKYQRITQLRDSLLKGADFALLAQKASEDSRSAANGGELGYVGRQQTTPIIDNFIFSSKIGDMSPILRSRGGYHIVKVTGDRPLSNYDDTREQIRNLYKQSRYSYDLDQLVRGIKAELNAKIDEKPLETILHKIDTTKSATSDNWDSLLTATDRSLILCTYVDKKVVLDSLVGFMKTQAEYKNIVIKQGKLKEAAEKLVQNYVLQYKTRNLENESPEFAGILKEYREGLMIYKLEQENIWSKVAVNDSALRVFYNDRKSEFRYGDRVDFGEVFLTSDSAARVCIDSLKAGVEFDLIAARHTYRVGMKKKLGRWGMTETKANPVAQQAYTMEVGAISQQPVKVASGYSIFKIFAKDPAREKTFEEASSEVAIQYQDYLTKKLEAEWVETLKEKTPVKIFEDALMKIHSNN